MSHLFGNSVRCFLVAAETLNFSQAARQLGISQQAVSKAISRLEEKLDLTLFARDRRVLQLTQSGAACYALFKETSVHLQKDLEDLRARAKQCQRTLSVGYQNYVDLTELLAVGITRIKETNSDLAVVCEGHSPAGLLDGLTSGRLDLIILCQRFLPEKSRFQTAFLTELPLLLLYFSLGDHNLDTLRRAPFIIDRLEGEADDALEVRVEQETTRIGLIPRQIVVSPNRDSAYSAAEMGQGILLCTSLSRFLASSDARTCDTGVSDNLVCCWRGRAHNTRSAEFAQILQDSAGELNWK